MGYNAEMMAWRMAETTPVRVVNGKVIAPSPYVKSSWTAPFLTGTIVETTDGEMFTIPPDVDTTAS